MEDEDYKRYVCVEPGCVNGMTTVEAKKELVLKQTIVVVEEMWVVCWIQGGGGEMADYRSRLNILYAVWYSESWKGSSSFYKWIPPET